MLYQLVHYVKTLADTPHLTVDSLRLVLLSRTVPIQVPLNMEQIRSVFPLKTFPDHESVLWEIESPVRNTVSKYSDVLVSE